MKAGTVFLHLAGHSHPAIQSEHDPIEHHILHAILDHPRKFLWPARSRRELHNPQQAAPNFMTHHGRHPRVEQARRDRDDSDAVPRKVPRQRKGKRRYRAFAGGVGHLTRLAVKGSGGGHEDQHAAFAVWVEGLYFGEVRKRLSDEIDGAADVDVHHEVEAVEIEGVAVPIDDLATTLGSGSSKWVLAGKGTLLGFATPAAATTPPSSFPVCFVHSTDPFTAAAMLSLLETSVRKNFSLSVPISWIKNSPSSSFLSSTET